MSKNYNSASDTVIKKRPVAGVEEKEFAEDLLQEKGYVPSPKPRRVNGGQDTVGTRHTERNRVRLNTTLSKAPAQAMDTSVYKSQSSVAERTVSFS